MMTSMPACCTLIATSVPSRSVPRCTCPMDAAASARDSIDVKMVSRLPPPGHSSACMVARTSSSGRAGMESCSAASTRM